MKPNPIFTNQNHEFWACVKLISQKLKYSEKGVVIIPSEKNVKRVFTELKLSTKKIFNNGHELTEFGEILFKYFQFRAEILNKEVERNLMNVDEAKKLFEMLNEQYKPKYTMPLNKQKNEKKATAFFTGIIITLIEHYLDGTECIYDPRQITAFTHEGFPARSLSRRVDGSFPGEINPIAIWEIKEYYYTTTFGSRIADGVYETMLDGYELMDARKILGRSIFHYLMIDSHQTWWVQGKPYLCRIVDMLHMGLITECLIGKEVVTRIPELVEEWLQLYKKSVDDFSDGQLMLTLS